MPVCRAVCVVLVCAVECKGCWNGRKPVPERSSHSGWSRFPGFDAHRVPAKEMGRHTAFPTPSSWDKRGGARHLQKTLGTSGHSGSGRGTLALPAMAVPSSIDTGTPAPPDLLPLDPVSTHRNGTSLCRNPARDLIFTRGRHRRDNGLTSNYKVCRRRRPRPQLTP